MTVRIYPAPQDQANIIYWSSQHPPDCVVCGGVGLVRVSRLRFRGERRTASWPAVVAECPMPFGLDALVDGAS